MSAKSLLRYRSAVGGDDLLSPAPGDKKSSGDQDQGSGPESGHSRNRLEEDDSFDEGIDDILAQNPSCNLCGHNFSNTADFLGHVRMHFSGGGSGKRKPENSPPPQQQEQRHHSPPQHQQQQSSTPVVPNVSKKRKSESQLPQVNNKVAKQSPPPPHYNPEQQKQQPQQRRAPSRPQQHQKQEPTLPQQQLAGDSAALFELLNSQYSQEIQAQGAAAAAAQAASPFQTAGGFPGFPGSLHNFPGPAPFGLPHPGLFHPGYSPGVHPLLPPHPVPGVPAQAPRHETVFKCFACPATFEKREAFLYHLQFHQQGLPPGFLPNGATGQDPSQYGPGAQGGVRRLRSSPVSGGSPPYSVPPPGSRDPHVPECTQSPRCTCQQCVNQRQAKKKKQVEDIDPETLKKIKALEWERKHGYWCTKCKKRFSSQVKLVDHMSYSVEHNYQKEAAEKKRKTSQGSVGSNQPSPASSVDSLGSSPSPGSVSPFNDIMSVLSPT